MSKQSVHDFRKAVNSDAELQAKLKSMGKVDVVAFAAENGFEFSSDDLSAVADEIGDELSDLELELVSGGAYYSKYTTSSLSTDSSSTSSGSSTTSTSSSSYTYC